MAFPRPTLSELFDRILNDVRSRLPGADSQLRRSNLRVLSTVLSAAVHNLYGYIAWTAEQLIYDTAESSYLERWASIWTISRLPASFATGSVTFSGVAGITIPAGTELQRGDGALFTVNADATFTGSTVVATVTAVEAGAAGNTATGSTLLLTTPIDSVSSSIVAGTLSGGTDVETDLSLRARLLARIQNPPHGGNRNDYVAWALEVPGVTRVWVTSLYTTIPETMAAGAVKVRFVRDNDAVTIIPDAGEVATVQAYLDSRRPVTVALTVAAPTAVPLNFTIAVTPTTQTVKDAVTAELTDLIKRESEPGGTLYISHIRAAISAAAGETNYTMTTPAADIVNTVGNMTTMGTITWA